MASSATWGQERGGHICTADTKDTEAGPGGQEELCGRFPPADKSRRCSWRRARPSRHVRSTSSLTLTH